MGNPHAHVAPGKCEVEFRVIAHQHKHNDDGVEERGLLHQVDVVVRLPLRLLVYDPVQRPRLAAHARCEIDSDRLHSRHAGDDHPDQHDERPANQHDDRTE